jgi:hypothetical protein
VLTAARQLGFASTAAWSLAIVWTLTLFAQVGPFAASPGVDGRDLAPVAPWNAHVPYPFAGSSAAQGETVAASAEQAGAAVDERVTAVQALLRGTPLEAHAGRMVAAADQYGIDWRLMPVIAVLESGGGVAACGGNAWGFARCQVRFSSFEDGIPVVASTLASYGPYQPATLLCIWVSGDGCQTRHAVAYTHRAAYLYAQLGGSLAVQALPGEAQVALPELPASGPEAAGVVETPTAEASRTPEVSPTADASPSAAPEEPAPASPSPPAEETPAPEPTPTR